VGRFAPHHAAQLSQRGQKTRELANGVRLARLAYEGTSEVPEVTPGTGAGQVNASVSQVHVFFELGDHLGSTSVVLDKATSELVERSTFQSYGATESDYRPGRWNAFREDYKFTGKEEDAEVGLTYFGKRYLNAYLGRWISADPLAIHAPGEADLNVYAYVSGGILKNVDPLGLEEDQTQNASFEPNQSLEGGGVSDGTHEQNQSYLEPSGSGQGYLQSTAPNCWAAGCHPVTGEFLPTVAEQTRPSAETARTVLEVSAGAVPVLGETVDVATLLSPNSSTTERVLAGVGLVLPFVGGALLRRAASGVDAATKVDRAGEATAELATKGGVAFRAIDPQYAQSTAENGFYLSGAPGHGIYANSTIEGAIKEFQFHVPDVIPAVFEVRVPSGLRLQIDPPSGYFKQPLPFTEGANILEAPSVRAPGTINLLIRDGATPGARVQ